MVEVEWKAVDPNLPTTFVACVPLREGRIGLADDVP
jgi:hypothetical protein